MRRWTALPLLVAIACSQRVTPEEEYAARAPERPRLGDAEVAALTAASAEAGDGAAAGAAADANAIRVVVDGPLDREAPAPDVAGSSAGEVLFVYVRPVGVTSGPPLAVRRIPGPTFPAELTISESDAMIPGTTFPERVTVQARLDVDGVVNTTGPDDWTAASDPVAPGGEARLALERAAGP